MAETGGAPDARRSAAVVRAAVLAAQAAAGDRGGLRRAVRGARRRCDRVTGDSPSARLARSLDTVHRYGAGRRRLELAVRALRELPEPQRDPALRAVLAAALAAAASGPLGRRHPGWGGPPDRRTLRPVVVSPLRCSPLNTWALVAVLAGIMLVATAGGLVRAGRWPPAATTSASRSASCRARWSASWGWCSPSASAWP